MNRKKIFPVLIIAVCGILSAIKYYCCRYDVNGNDDFLEQVRQGDFTALRGLSEKQLEELNHVYERCQSTEETQWIYADIDNDGDAELIWQEKDYVADSQIHRILAVFAVSSDGCRRIVWDVGDMGEFYFYHNGKIIYFAQFLGVYDYYFYGVCEYSEKGELKVNTTFEVYDLYDLSEYNAADFLAKFDWAEDVRISEDKEGEVYYVIGTRITDEESARVLINKEEWLERFEKDIGAVLLMN